LRCDVKEFGSVVVSLYHVPDFRPGTVHAIYSCRPVILMRLTKETGSVKSSVLIPLGLALSILMIASGCRTATPYMDRLDPTAPAAAGLPATPGPDEPIPLGERPIFGLYTETPTAETLAQLSMGKLSPDQRYRAAVTPQGIWVARVDGAWVWQVPLPAQPVPQTGQQPPQDGAGNSPGAAGQSAQNTSSGQNGQNAQTSQSPVPAPGPAMVDWEAPSTLLIRDTRGLWWKASPDWITVTRMATPPAIQTPSQQGGAAQPQSQAPNQQPNGRENTKTGP